MMHQVGHPPQNASGTAKQIVWLAGHSASPHSTALVSNVLAFDSMVLDLCRLESNTSCLMF